MSESSSTSSKRSSSRTGSKRREERLKEEKERKERILKEREEDRKASLLKSKEDQKIKEFKKKYFEALGKTSITFGGTSSNSEDFFPASSKLIGEEKRKYHIEHPDTNSSEEDVFLITRSESDSTSNIGSSIHKMESQSTMNVKEVDEILQSATQLLNESNFKASIDRILDDCGSKLLDWVNSSVAFAGFDAVIMRKKIMSKANAQQIILCVLIGLVRGNNIERISKTMKSQETQKTFNAVIKILNLKKNVAGDYSAITLSRIIACFPEAVCRILYKNEIPMAVNYLELKKINPEYPMVSRHQVCASIIPGVLSNEEIMMAFDVIMVPYMKVSEIVNSKNKEWTKLNNLHKAEKSSMFLHNSFNSKVLPETDRIRLCEEFQIIVSNKLTSPWRAAAGSAKRWLMDRYGFSNTESG